MNVPESFNPYQAPEVQEQDEVRLGEDSEFLISEREILCRETVKLPKICIHTGEPADLQRQATFRSPQIPLVVFIILIPFLLAGVAGGSEMILLAIAGLFMFALIRRLTTWTFPGVTTIDTTWYVNSDYSQRCYRQQWMIRGVILVAAFLGGYVISYNMTPPGNPTSMRDASLTALFSAVFFGGLSLTLRIERRLSYSRRRRTGPHKGLFALNGHSRRFAETVERIIHGGF